MFIEVGDLIDRGLLRVDIWLPSAWVLSNVFFLPPFDFGGRAYLQDQQNHQIMERRAFIATALLALPAFACSTSGKLAAPLSKAFVVRAGSSRFGVPTPFMGVNPNDLKLSSKDSGGQVSVFDYIGVQKVGPSFHAHPDQDEVFFVVEGSYVFKLGESKHLLHTGDLIFLPRNIPHTWVQMSDTGQMFYFLQPAGKMEEFFVKMTEVGGTASREELASISVAHGIRNHGRGLSATDEHLITEQTEYGFIVRAGQSRFGEKTKINGQSPNDIKVSGADTGSELSIFEYTGHEKGGPPLHVHPDQDEVFFVTQGDYLFECAGEQFSLQKGDMIFLPRGLPHAFAQRSELGKMLFFFQPAGKMEDFFRALGNPGIPPPSDVFERHNMRVVGPPISY